MCPMQKRPGKGMPADYLEVMVKTFYRCQPVALAKLESVMQGFRVIVCQDAAERCLLENFQAAQREKGTFFDFRPTTKPPANKAGNGKLTKFAL